MSALCGLCGKFYNQQCSRWPSCTPMPEADVVWEYLIDGVNLLATDGDDMLNAYGKDGWELVSTTLQPNAVTAFFFKRKKR